MLVMVNRDGYVLASIPGLAKRAGISLPDCEASLAKLQAPDAYSQSKEEEGRRIKVVDGGWFIINYEKYRHQLSTEEQRDKDRIRKAEYRLAQKMADVPNCPNLSHDVPSCPAESDIASATVSVAEDKSRTRSLRSFEPPTLREVTEYCMERNSDVDPEKFHAYYTSQGWYVGKNRMKNWQAAVRTWERNNHGGQFHGGYQASSTGISKHQQRVINNREAILTGLGISPMPGQREPSVQNGDASGAGPDMAGRLLKGKA